MSPKNIFTRNTRTNGRETPKQNTNELLSNAKLLPIIIKKVTKEKHEHSGPQVKKGLFKQSDGTLKKCKKLLKQGANPEVLKEVLIKLEKSPEEQKEYYTQRFLPELKEEIKQSQKLDPTKKDAIGRIISEIIGKSSNKDPSPQSRRGSMESEESEPESGYVSDAGDDSEKDSISNESISDTIISEDQELEISEETTVHSENSKFESSEVETDEKVSEPISHAANKSQEVETDGGIANNNAQLLEAIKNRNQKKFEKYLKDCTDISSVKDEKGNNILHLIASLRKEQKCNFLDTLVKSFKKDLVQLVSGENQDRETPFQVALINKITKGKHESNTTQDNDNTLKFLVKLLEHGASHDQLKLSSKELQDLNEEQKIYYRNFLEKLAELGKKLKSEINIEAKKAIVHTINTPDSNGSYLLHLAVENNDKKDFEELLQENADITAEDGNGNNVLHHIASLKGWQKVAYLNLILDLVERKTISKEKFSEAVIATNKEGWTPLQVALAKKAKKGKYLLQVKTISDPTINYDNTTKFCATLLQNGANADSLWLKNEKCHTDKYHLVLRDLKDYSKTPHKAQKKARKTKEQLEEIYKIKTRSKKFQHIAQKVGSSPKKAASTVGKALSATRKRIDLENRILRCSIMAIMITVIAITAAAFFQGQMAAGAAIPIILTAVIIFAVTLKFNSIKKHFEKPDTKNPQSRIRDTSTELSGHGVPHHNCCKKLSFERN